MSCDACCDGPGLQPTDTIEEQVPWWRDRGVMVPVASGVALLAGFAASWTGLGMIAQVLFWTALLLGGWTFAPGAIKRLVQQRKLGIGLLMTISAIGAIILGYVEEAAALAFLYSIAEALEDKAMDRARAGLRSLLSLVPNTVNVRRGAVTTTLSLSELRIGDVMVVRPGERVPSDGIVRTGRTSLDTAAITGESIPIEVGPDDTVSAGSVNGQGVLDVEATAAGTDNSLTQLVALVEQAQAVKGDRARIADRLARPLVPGVIVLALAVGVIGSLLGDPTTWITRALVVLVAASPCALAISVPLTVVAGIGGASRFGVIIKSGAAFERFGTIRHVALDKTGTLTRNRPTVTRVLSAPGVDPDAVLAWASALERHSTHPLAAAINAAAGPIWDAADVIESPGEGVRGSVDGIEVAVGSPRWLHPGPLAADVAALERDGATVVVVHRGGQPVGAIGVRDELRPEVPAVVAELRRAGLGITMLTGDNEATARALATQAGIDDVRAALRPEDKASAVTALVGPTAMIGDGINDAPALAAADLGIAMGVTGSDAAIEASDVAFTGHDLRLIPQALTHARRGRAIITQNLGFSIAIIVVLLPLAITGVLGLAAVVLVHEAAEVLVILNGLRAARTPAPSVGVRAARNRPAG